MGSPNAKQDVQFTLSFYQRICQDPRKGRPHGLFSPFLDSQLLFGYISRWLLPKTSELSLNVS
jgi:hypothetical protein